MDSSLRTIHFLWPEAKKTPTAILHAAGAFKFISLGGNLLICHPYSIKN